MERKDNALGFGRLKDARNVMGWIGAVVVIIGVTGQHYCHLHPSWKLRAIDKALRLVVSSGCCHVACSMRLHWEYKDAQNDGRVCRYSVARCLKKVANAQGFFGTCVMVFGVMHTMCSGLYPDSDILMGPWYILLSLNFLMHSKYLQYKYNQVLEDRQDNQAVDSMSDEWEKMIEQLQKPKVEINSLLQQLGALEEQQVSQAVDSISMSDEREKMVQQLQKAKVEVNSLVQQLGALEEQQSSHQQVQTTLAELQEQKSKLAYDKGCLQSRVSQLQKELDSLANGQMELVQSKKMVSALENKLHESDTVAVNVSCGCGNDDQP